MYIILVFLENLLLFNSASFRVALGVWLSIYVKVGKIVPYHIMKECTTELFFELKPILLLDASLATFIFSKIFLVYFRPSNSQLNHVAFK